MWQPGNYNELYSLNRKLLFNLPCMSCDEDSNLDFEVVLVNRWSIFSKKMGSILSD